jgi:hypothetical protein
MSIRERLGQPLSHGTRTVLYILALVFSCAVVVVMVAAEGRKHGYLVILVGPVLAGFVRHLRQGASERL